MTEQTKRRDSTVIIVIGIVTLILALGFTALFLVFPAAGSGLLSLKQFNMMNGLFNSPWTGLANYAQLFQAPAFRASLLWTGEYAAASAGMLFALSLVAGVLLTAAGEIRWLRHALCTLLLLPLVVPGELWAQAFRAAFSADGAKSVWLMAFWSALKYIGLPALLATAALSHGKRRWTVPLLSGGVAALALFALCGRADYTFLRALYAPGGPVGIDEFVLRTAMMQMRLSLGAAAQVTQVAIHALALAAAAFPVFVMLRRLFPAASAPDATRIRDRLVSLAAPVALLPAAFAVSLVYSLIRGTSNIPWAFFSSLPVYVLLALFSSFCNTVLCFCLARPAACGSRAGKPAMAILLLLLTAVSIPAYTMGEYLIFRSLGFVNTWFAVALSGIGSVWGVWPLVFAARGMGVQTGTDWFKRMWKPAVALFAVQAALRMNDTTPSLIYINEAPNQHVLLALSNVMQLNQTTVINPFMLLMIVAAVMAVPVALLLTVRTVFDEKDNLALFMPGK